jgi:hypothetical protein
MAMAMREKMQEKREVSREKKTFLLFFFSSLLFTRRVKRLRADWCCFMRGWSSLGPTNWSRSLSGLKELRQKDMKNPSGS